jgi:hypothetical protein
LIATSSRSEFGLLDAFDHLATSPLLAGIGGRYFEDCNEAVVVSHRSADFMGVARYALDPTNAERLWSVSLALIS